MNRMKKDYTNFNRNLRMFREKRGITANELADKIGISRNTYLAYESQNREPSYAILIKIANTLHVSTDDLLGILHIDDLQQYIGIVEKAGFWVERENNHIGVFWNCGREADDDIDGVFFSTEEDFIYCIKNAVDIYSEITERILGRELYRAFSAVQKNMPKGKTVSELLNIP